MRDTANTEAASCVEDVRAVSALVSLCAIAVANYTNLYREPDESISDIDEIFGSLSDVEDPLLTAHRAAKFFLISAGDCVHSMSTLLSADFPNFVGASAIARSGAEHASRSMYMSDPNISYRERLLRISALIASSLREYKSTHDVAATTLIDKWNRWRSRNHREFTKVTKQKFLNATGLIQRYFASEGMSCYEELSRPTHGNATWLIMTVISEQKETAFARVLLARSAMFATRCVIAASASLAALWEIDLDDVLRLMGEETGWDRPITWVSLVNEVDGLSQRIESIDETQFIDVSTDPQPRR